VSVQEKIIDEMSEVEAASAEVMQVLNRIVVEKHPDMVRR
jgi:hypothetical protein